MSGITINIRNNFPQVVAAIERIGGEAGEKAMVRALNAAVTQGKTAMSRTISKEFRVTVAQARDRLDVRRARSNGREVKFNAILLAGRKTKGRGMNLIHYVTRIPQRTKKGTLAQLQFQVKRSGGRKTIQSAFVATNKATGGRAVFIRQGKARMPIKTVTSIDVPQMFNTRRINSVVREVMLQRFDVNFKRELRAVLKGFAK